jgi:GNAT superfamily N-acetyltransferase
VTYRGPESLDPHHVLEGFDCGKPPLNLWLLRRALANQHSGASRTWVVTDEHDRVVAYYASATASIIRAAATRRAARNQPEDVPAVLLARMAVHLDHHGQGLGAALLKHFVLKALEVAEIVGVRVLLVHAQDEEAKSFYVHHDFEPSPVDDLTLMRVVQDIL